MILPKILHNKGMQFKMKLHRRYFEIHNVRDEHFFCGRTLSSMFCNHYTFVPSSENRDETWNFLFLV